MTQNMHKEALVSKSILCQYFTIKCVRILWNTAVHWLNLTPKNRIVRILEPCKIEYFLYKPP